MTLCGLLHSDICGSMSACDSPQLFAAYRVLLRLLVPRHPPYALIRLTFFYIISDADLFIYPQLNNANLFNWALKYCYFLFTHISSLVKKLSVQFARLEIVLPFTEKLFHYTLCSFQRTFWVYFLLTESSLKIKQLNFHSLHQTFDVSAAIAAP